MERKRLFLIVLLSASLSIIVVGPAWGQASTSLRGTVTDPSGAAIPNATVHLINSGTNAERVATTDQQGSYAFIQVIPGTYQLKAEASGFSTYLQNGIVLQVNLPATVNVKMKLGQAQIVVEVSGQAPVINTTDASEGNTMGSFQIQQLPIEAKDVVQLLSLQPGVVYASDRSDFNTNN
ncbi:MAG: carboxypeptidase-like regulatory domain-containing protein, partial [Blastocatellia bacterium]